MLCFPASCSNLLSTGSDSSPTDRTALRTRSQMKITAAFVVVVHLYCMCEWVGHHRAWRSSFPSSGSKWLHTSGSRSPRSQSQCFARDEFLHDKRRGWKNRQGHADRMGWIFLSEATECAADLSVSSSQELLTKCRPVVSPNTGDYWGQMYWENVKTSGRTKKCENSGHQAMIIFKAI